QRRPRRALAPRRCRGTGLSRLRDRSDDLVGRARRLPRQDACARRRGDDDRHELSPRDRRVSERRHRMTIKVGINGFGRIGRQVYRAMRQHYPERIDVLAVNDVGNRKIMTHLLKYDTNYGRFPGDVRATADGFVADGHEVKILAERDPGRLPWKQLGVDVVVESTGFFREAAKARAHLEAGARKVIITAPAKNEDITIVLGVNERSYDPARHHIISNASCTTNGLAPVAKVLFDRFGIEKGILT